MLNFVDPTSSRMFFLKSAPQSALLHNEGGGGNVLYGLAFLATRYIVSVDIDSQPARMMIVGVIPVVANMLRLMISLPSTSN